MQSWATTLSSPSAGGQGPRSEATGAPASGCHASDQAAGSLVHLLAVGNEGGAVSQSNHSQDGGPGLARPELLTGPTGRPGVRGAGPMRPRVGAPGWLVLRWPSPPSCVARPWGWRPGLWETDTDSLWFRERRPHLLGSPCIQVGRALEPAYTWDKGGGGHGGCSDSPARKCVHRQGNGWQWTAADGTREWTKGQQGSSMQLRGGPAGRGRRRAGGRGGWPQPGYPGGVCGCRGQAQRAPAFRREPCP